MGVMMYIVPIIAILIFVLTFVLIFSPKARGKMMSKNIKSMRYMLDESKEDIEHLSTNMINSTKNIVDKSKDDIESISENMANATKSGVETTTRAIKKGLTEENVMYCKHCGTKIDKDSKFCKHCGNGQ